MSRAQDLEYVDANGQQLALRRIGDPAAPPLLLIGGLGMQLTDWPPLVLDGLTTHFQVIAFDNRDSGLSLLCGPAADPAEPVPETLDGAADQTAAYTLFDMAEDTAALLDALGIDRVCMVGMSMGGMIAQVVAARHPARVAALVSMMSSGGQVRLDTEPAVEAAMLDFMRVREDPAEAAAAFLRSTRAMWSPAYPFPEELIAQATAWSVARSYRPTGILRQLRAVASGGDRRDLLRSIAAPTLVVHGTADPCVPIKHAEDAVALIPGARLESLPGVGHFLPGPLMASTAETMARFCGTAMER